MEQIIKIAEFILKSFIHIWPYLLVTIPLAVVINLSGASKYITRAFDKKPLLAVLFATVTGAFSPFCSCGVIPVISSLLIGGVPLAPVMSFWIASPSMDPEIFFLSTTVIGWKLAIWRLSSTFVMSLLAGYITHFMTVKGFIGIDILRTKSHRKNQITLRSFLSSLKSIIMNKQDNRQLIFVNPASLNNICCTVSASSVQEESKCSSLPEVNACNCKVSDNCCPISVWKRIATESLSATLMVTKFMAIAFLITYLITFYLPQDLIHGLVRGNATVQVVLATLIGIPMYTSNITALPMVGGLIELGLNKGAALSFLIGGATTTLPAMVAVWGITKRRVFILYLSFALFGALFAGLCFNLFN